MGGSKVRGGEGPSFCMSGSRSTENTHSVKLQPGETGVEVNSSESVINGNTSSVQVSSISNEIEEPPDERDLSKLAHQKDVWEKFIVHELKLNENKMLNADRQLNADFIVEKLRKKSKNDKNAVKMPFFENGENSFWKRKM